MEIDSDGLGVRPIERTYRLTYDAGTAGVVAMEKTAEEWLTPNGTESLLDWMLRESDRRGSSTFTLERVGGEGAPSRDDEAMMDAFLRSSSQHWNDFAAGWRAAREKS